MSKLIRNIILGICAVAVIGGACAIYRVNKSDNKEALSEVKDEEPEEVEQTLEETPEQIPEQAPAVKDSGNEETAVKNENKKENTQENKTQKEAAKKKETQKKQPEKKNEKKTNSANTSNGPITYKSSNLGITFDMPASWKDKYYIEDNNSIIRIYTKADDNSDGKGLLITITTDAEYCHNGDYLDSIADQKVKKINGKTYYFGGPTDFRMGENDPLKELYIKMLKEREQVVKSLR